MAYIYAQLNNEDICIGISQLAEFMESVNLISLDAMDFTLLNKRYNRDTNEWSEVTDLQTVTEEAENETAFE